MHKGDVVRVELDMSGVGTLKFIVNGVEAGVAFTGLAGLSLYPVICFYGAGRAVALLRAEAFS